MIVLNKGFPGKEGGVIPMEEPKVGVAPVNNSPVIVVRIQHEMLVPSQPMLDGGISVPTQPFRLYKPGGIIFLCAWLFTEQSLLSIRSLKHHFIGEGKWYGLVETFGTLLIAPFVVVLVPVNLIPLS